MDRRSEAVSAYQQLMTKVVAFFQVAKKIGVDIDIRVNLNRFDVLLQYSLLQVALADNFLDIEEVKLIRDLSDYCDFCSFLNQSGYSNVTWQDIYNANEYELKGILKDYEKDVIALNKEFIDIASVIDAKIEEDLMKGLIEDTTKIFAVLSLADNDFDIREKEMTFKSLIFLSYFAIIDLREKIKSTVSNQQTHTDEKKSLKDFYLKKKK